ncbi:hypothetical protein MmmBen181_0282 [Mycoplasma mycoides subsp. mycoides]|uniref:Membrane protein n=2 Tax=Mycoplasma mycoides subsp. mycoides TaxID=2103 RepID=A0AAE2EHN6_MYCMY|nr:hypothetical protein mycmycITA_00279 [Mycoplasma mycoides subsp. mycoides]PTD32218.1 hypothetical protein MSCc_5450 [Mycoplasma mycoides subsp. mycoides C425/93]PTD33528.1 hypothetical protein MSCa_7100 [Mycoplasma mycoides subsp. mycoides PO-67]PTD33605.1 putative transmembrane protein [Mycoplasma mycoides subsp. mycoides str. Gemu Goffa]CAE76893.1 hypothetical transmembrane protein [Mycoplasma mycoides subsp. mycoides SC str. PG1]BCU84287.1 hypothetical protein mmcaprivi_06660 [Mycoplasma
MSNFTKKQKLIFNILLIVFSIVGLIGFIFYLTKFINLAIIFLSISGIGFILLMIIWFVFEKTNKKGK